MKLKELLSMYLKHHILREPTERQYKLVVNSAENFARRDLRLSEITVDLLLDYRKDVLTRNAATTFNNYRRHLSALFNFAVKKNAMAINPFQEVKAAPIPKLRPKTVPVDLLQDVMNFLSKSGDRYDNTPYNEPLSPRWFWLIVVKTLYMTGMRRRQIIEIKLKDVDLERKTLRLRAEGSKAKNEWTIPLATSLIPELRYLFDRVRAIKGNNPEQQLFCYPLFSTRRFRAREMNVDHVSKMFQRISQSQGLRISSHRIRHTTATVLARSTKNIKLVQEMLGHADLRTTCIYVEPEIEQMRLLVNGMNVLPNCL